MFSRRLFIFTALVLFVSVNLILISMSSRKPMSVSGPERVFMTLVGPFQRLASHTVAATGAVWKTYFASVVSVRENRQLREDLARLTHIENQNTELMLENQRLKKFVSFTRSDPETYVAARVIARDPSPWFKTITIDKGDNHGIRKGFPVLVSEGIVGQVITVAGGFSRVLLVTDRNSAVDALVQTTRARGMVKGTNEDICTFVFALRKDEIQPGDMVVSSGMDQVYPKGLRIGRILEVRKDHTQLFQDITIQTSVDFDRLEEVLVYKK